MSRMGKLPANEMGFPVCQLPGGELTRGPVSWGSPTSVKIQLQCPGGSKFLGLSHTHPGGVAYPSAQDVRSAFESGAQALWIMSDNDFRTFPVQR
jgi:hypothetical protein